MTAADTHGEGWLSAAKWLLRPTCPLGGWLTRVVVFGHFLTCDISRMVA